MKASPAQPTRPRPLAHQKSGFLHAKGSSSKATGSVVSGYSSGASSIGKPDRRERSEAKFFHANGTPDATLPLPSAGYSRAGSTIESTVGSTVSSASMAQPPRLAAPKGRGIPRPVSLQKTDSGSSYFPPKAVTYPQISPVLAVPNVSPHVTGNRRSVQEGRPDPRRVMSGHKKSQSMAESISKSASMMDVRSSVGSSHGSEVSSASSAHPNHLDQIVNTPDVSTPAIQTPFPEDDDSTDTSVIDNATIASGLQSPLKAGGNLERMNELAAEARRERKVMDLEITNSSLAAINKTLEREMRKQKAELQRFRRLSRSGRLSIIPGSSKPKNLRRSLLSALSELGEEDEDMDDDGDSDPDEAGDTEDEDEEDLDSADDDAELSPAALAESDARHQKRDEQRLALDLSKHQQLLVDSQKMNQSLKKCLGWTEELIKDGKKALAYRVYAEDVKLGGRILVDDDHDEDGDPEHMESFEVTGEYFVEERPDVPGYGAKDEAEIKPYGRGPVPSNGDRPSEDFQSDP